MVLRFWGLMAFLFALTGFSFGQADNLARSAKATASEFQPGLPPEQANDGKEDSRWSGIPGHNSGVWFQLDWPQPVTIAQLVVKQYQRYSWEWDIQVWDDAAQEWKTVQHDGKADVALPLVVVDTFDKPISTRKLRIGNITHGPSFNEVEVFAKPTAYPPVVSLASDLRGNFVGMVSDWFGSTPLAGKMVTLSCKTSHGAVKVSGISNDKGMLFARMPIGLVGEVQADFDGHRQTFKAAQFQRAITPKDHVPLHDRMFVEAPQFWKFMPDPPAGIEKTGFPDSTWKPIRVPAHWEMEGFRSKSGVGGYRMHFGGNPSTGRRELIRFNGVYSGADVWVNGQLVASHLGGFTPFEADITNLLRKGDNVLAVRVTEHTLVSDQMDKMSQYADFGLGGIMRPVEFIDVPDTHVESYQQQCVWAGKKAAIAGSVSLLNAGSASQAGSVTATLVDAQGQIAAKSAKIPFQLNDNSDATFPFQMEVANAHPWNAEKPYLYTLKFEVAGEKGVIQVLRQPVGLRETSIQGTQILINGTAVKFNGTCHHDQDPLLGRAVTPEIERKDLDMIKGANLNSVRTSHYPPLEDLIDYADKIGLYVEDEADFCWVGVSNDLRNTPQIVQLTGEMIARDRNHPSVFMWSLCNESEFGYGFERSHEWVRQIDPSRPTGAATSAWLEIATLHNPISIKRIDENEKLDKPMLFDEAWCIYQGIFNDVAEMWVDPGMRDYYAEPLKGIWDAFERSKVTQGSQIWAWSDDIFCVPGRGPSYGRGTTQSHFIDNIYQLPGRGLVGDAPWGVVDGWRREKPEYWITKHLQSPIHVDEHPYVSGQDTPITIHNGFDFTNLSELSFRYSFGSDPIEHPLDVSCPPRTKLEFKIPALQSRGPLTLTAYARSGRLIDRWQFPVVPKPIWHTDGPSLTMTQVPMLAGNTVSVDGAGFHLSFDTDSGFLRECVADGQPTLLELPSLHVLPTATPLQEMPDRTGWHMTSMTQSLSPDGRSFRAQIKGGYPDFEGQYELELTAGGTMTVKSEFKFTGKPMLSREIGMRFSVPRGCDTLTWNRNPEFAWLPANHIGRAIGSAKAFASHPDTVPPTWDYKDDNSPMGTNDFRSTKRNVNFAAIRYRTGPGVFVFGNGAQAVRAIADTDRISVHVNDWYGGTNVGWGEWIQNYGRGKEIKTGDVLKSELKIDLLRRK